MQSEIEVKADASGRWEWTIFRADGSPYRGGFEDTKVNAYQAAYRAQCALFSASAQINKRGFGQFTATSPLSK